MIDAKVERQIITGMIVNTEFLKGINQIYEEQFQTLMARRIGGWCIEHFKQYDQAPVQHIEDIFKRNKKRLKKDEKFLIEEFLMRLSKKYESSNGFNVEYILDIAEEYFRKVAIDQLRDKLGSALEKGKVTKAENLIKRFERTARPTSNGVDPFSHEAILRAFREDEPDKMFGFPGELGKVIGTFEREYLISFFGTRGKGKTWWLLWVALLAVFKGYNVVFVSLEMSEKQLVRRVHQYISGLPLKKGKEVKIPVFSDEESRITRFKASDRKELSIPLISKKIAAMDDSSLFKGNLKMLFYPSGTKTVDDLRSQLQNMEHYSGFVPDVIVTDYADKFKSSFKTESRRHQLEDVWNEHKALAQERKCLVATASQANTARTGKDVGEGTATESMAKEDLCDVIIALNQRPEEKKQGVMRLGVTKHRHDIYDIQKEVYVTQCFQIGRPYLDSMLKTKKKKS